MFTAFNAWVDYIRSKRSIARWLVDTGPRSTDLGPVSTRPLVFAGYLPRESCKNRHTQRQSGDSESLERLVRFLQGLSWRDHGTAKTHKLRCRDFRPFSQQILRASICVFIHPLLSMSNILLCWCKFCRSMVKVKIMKYGHVKTATYGFICWIFMLLLCTYLPRNMPTDNPNGRQYKLFTSTSLQNANYNY